MRSTIFNDRPKKKVRFTNHPQMVNVYKYGLGFIWICTFAQHRRAQVLIVAQPGFPKATMQQDAKQLVGTCWNQTVAQNSSASTAQVRLAYHTWSSERPLKLIPKQSITEHILICFNGS